MAYYALIDDNNIVVRVITGRDEHDNEVNGVVYDWEDFYGAERNLLCKRTSYNTFGNQHRLGGVPFRKNFAGIGDTWDEERDAFIPSKPFPSWLLNEETCRWEPPTPKPSDLSKHWVWDEDALEWRGVE